MATNGINSVSDLLSYRFASAAEVGLDTINTVIQKDLAYHNAIVADALRLLADPTSDQRRIYGTSAALPMTEVDEFGKAVPRKNKPGVAVDFPLRRFSTMVGWTRTALKIAKAAEVARKYMEVRDGHTAEVVRQIKKAVYNNTNYTQVDNLSGGSAAGITLNVKRFLNADGAEIPNSPAGASFAGASHTHYFAITGAAVASTDIDYMVNHLTEHGNTQDVIIVINLADKALITGNGAEFRPLTPVTVVNNGQSATTVERMDNSDLENQFIGYWRDQAQVWVKPWAVAGYFFAFAAGAPEKPLAFREYSDPSLQGLRLDAQVEDYPMQAEAFEAVFGIGVWNRTNGVVMQVNSTTYSNPTIA